MKEGAPCMEEKKLSRREQKKIASRQAILQAAKKEFIRKGYKDASIAAIMEGAGLGVGTFYNYFSSKEEILMKLLASLLQDVAQMLEKMKREGRPAAERLTVGCRETVRLLDENSYVLALFLSVSGGHGAAMGGAHGAMKGASHPHDMPKGAPEAAMASRAPRIKDLFLAIIEEGQATGEFRADFPAPLMAEMLHSTFRSAAFSYAGVPFRENFDCKLRMLLEGVQKR